MPSQTYRSAMRRHLDTDMARALHDLGTLAKQLPRELDKASHVANDTESLQYEVEEAFAVANDIIDILRWSVDEFYSLKPREILASVKRASEYIPNVEVPA